MELTYNDFKKRALDGELSKWEKIGFPDSYRKGIEKLIFKDIAFKLGLESNSVKRILDIGCGCSDLVNNILTFCEKFDKTLTLVDSKEMLNIIPPNLKSNNKGVELVPGKFPNTKILYENTNKLYDAIIVYSVIQYPFIEMSIYHFINKCLELLNDNGKVLIGDIPNVSTRNRFIKSKDGISFQRNNITFAKNVEIQHSDEERIDDAVVLSILQRFRNFGFETYLFPQPEGLPFANRREDILIIKR